MKSTINLRSVILVTSLFCISAVLVACGGSGGGSSTGSGTGNTGSLALSLQDAPSEDYNAVYVTIKEIRVHMGGSEDDQNWELVASPDKTYNLLDLTNGVREELGIADLKTGDYTQMRLLLATQPDLGINILSQEHPYANYVITSSNDVHELKVPSGFQTGIKIVKGFTINRNTTTELIVDFDATRSVVKAGNSGKWLLKPTIKIVSDDEESAIVQGKVTDQTTPVAANLSGAMVSLQYNSGTQIEIEASSLTNGEGYYKLFASPGDYNLVAYKQGYQYECTAISLDADQVVEAEDFSLGILTSMGDLKIEVSISGPTDEQYATISIRTDACGTMVEVKSLNIIDGGTFTIEGLPIGTYEIVASSYDKTTMTYSVNVINGFTVYQNISL